MRYHHPATGVTFSRHLLTTVLVGVLAAASCSPSTDTAPDASPRNTTEATLPTEPQPMPVVRLPDEFEVTLELAITPDELAQGLMFRPNLAADRGMLLIFAEERIPSIWMMNTLVALDLVYLDSTGKVVEVITDAQPCPGEPCPRFSPKEPAKAVLEVPAGAAVEHGITRGLELEFVRVPGFPVGS
jgi:uncharacterized membrane protein (UPF0127 family)